MLRGNLSSIPRPTLNPSASTGEVDADGFLGLSSQPTYLVSSRLQEKILSQGREALEDPQLRLSPCLHKHKQVHMCAYMGEHTYIHIVLQIDDMCEARRHFSSTRFSSECWCKLGEPNPE